MRYGPVDVLRGVNLCVYRGEVVALLGPNGAGKTTTIEILEGFRKRSAGEVRVLGTDPEQGDEGWRARLGIVLQSWRDHGKWRIGELLAHLGRYYASYSTPEHTRPYNTDELISLVGLTKQANDKIAKLSGGQRRRLDVAIGLVGRPEILFLDEPTVGFDPQARQDFHGVLRRLSDRGETTILLTTHDLNEAEKLSSRILILAGGRVVADGSPVTLARQVSSRSEIRFSKDGLHYVHSAEDATSYVRALLGQYGRGIHNLEVRRASLEDVYTKIVQEFESRNVKRTPGRHARPNGRRRHAKPVTKVTA